jgi:hypothetical protein
MNQYSVKYYTTQQIFKIISNDNTIPISFIKNHVLKGYDINIELMDENGEVRSLFYFVMRDAHYYSDHKEILDIIEYFIENGLEINESDTFNYLYNFLRVFESPGYNKPNLQENIDVSRIIKIIENLKKCGMKMDTTYIYYDTQSTCSKCVIADIYSNELRDSTEFLFSSIIFKFNIHFENLFDKNHLMYLPMNTEKPLYIDKELYNDIYINLLTKLKDLFITFEIDSTCRSSKCAIMKHDRSKSSFT